MPSHLPIAERPFSTDAPRPTWPAVREHLIDARTYWLATMLPLGRPHVMPVLGVWVDDTLHFVANPASRKAKNLAQDHHCVVSTSSHPFDLVVDGVAQKVSDVNALQRVAAAYDAKYGWQVTARDGALRDTAGAPTAGPPPYEIYLVTPSTVFAFGVEEALGATRWDFSESGRRLQ